MRLESLADTCGQNVVPGTKMEVQYICADDIAAFPQTKAELGGGEMGDELLLAEPFELKSGKSWHKASILVNTGNAQDVTEGELGSMLFINRLNFFIIGTHVKARGLAWQLLKNSGALVFRIVAKQGVELVMGSKEFPAWIQEVSGGTGVGVGERNGYQYTAWCNSGKPMLVYPGDNAQFDYTVVSDPSGNVIIDGSGNTIGFLSL